MQSVEAATSAGGGVQTNPRPSLHKATKRASSQAKAEAAMKAGPPPLLVFMLLGGCGALMLLWLASLGDDSSLATRRLDVNVASTSAGRDFVGLLLRQMQIFTPVALGVCELWARLADSSTRSG